MHLHLYFLQKTFELLSEGQDELMNFEEEYFDLNHETLEDEFIDFLCDLLYMCVHMSVLLWTHIVNDFTIPYKGKFLIMYASVPCIFCICMCLISQCMGESKEATG